MNWTLPWAMSFHSCFSKIPKHCCVLGQRCLVLFITSTFLGESEYQRMIQIEILENLNLLFDSLVEWLGFQILRSSLSQICLHLKDALSTSRQRNRAIQRRWRPRSMARHDLQFHYEQTNGIPYKMRLWATKYWAPSLLQVSERYPLEYMQKPKRLDRWRALRRPWKGTGLTLLPALPGAVSGWPKSSAHSRVSNASSGWNARDHTDAHYTRAE